MRSLPHYGPVAAIVAALMIVSSARAQPVNIVGAG
jgi:hypothetical protein